MITKAQIKERQAELQEITDEFFKGLRCSIRPNDQYIDDKLREFIFTCARMHMSQVQFMMNEVLEQCQPQPEQRASADPGLRDLDLSELGIDKEQAARFDQLAIKQDTIAREDDAWLEAERRS